MILKGGRKHTVMLLSLVALLGLALLDAPDAAYLALGALAGTFFGAHAVADNANAKKPNAAQ